MVVRWLWVSSLCLFCILHPPFSILHSPFSMLLLRLLLLIYWFYVCNANRCFCSLGGSSCRFYTARPGPWSPTWSRRVCLSSALLQAFSTAGAAGTLSSCRLVVCAQQICCGMWYVECGMWYVVFGIDIDYRISKKKNESIIEKRWCRNSYTSRITAIQSGGVELRGGGGAGDDTVCLGSGVQRLLQRQRRKRGKIVRNTMLLSTTIY